MEKHTVQIQHMYTADEVAEMLTLSAKTVRELARTGKLNGFRIGTGKGQWRFFSSDVNRYLENCRNKSGD